MNLFLFLLYQVFIVIVIFLFYLALQYGQKVKNLRTISTVNETICKPTKEAIDITSLPCCVVGGVITGSKYVPNLDMVVSPSPISYLTVCKGFCPNGYADGVCGNTTYKEISDFNSCVEELKPSNCFGLAMPIAYSGATLYYGNSSSDLLCTTTSVCS